MDRSILAKLLDTWGAFLDAGLPSLVFVVVLTVSGRDLRLSLLVALGVAVALAVVRLIRRDKIGSVIAGVAGMAVSALIAWRTGRPRDVFALGLVINAGWFVVYLVSVLVRWPAIGVMIGLARNDKMAWRRDSGLARGARNATLLWMAMFAIRLAVQVPLYLTDHVGALGTVRVLLGWPLTIITLIGTFVVLKASVGSDAWVALRDDVVKVFTGRIEPRRDDAPAPAAAHSTPASDPADRTGS